MNFKSSVCGILHRIATRLSREGETKHYRKTDAAAPTPAQEARQIVGAAA